MKTSMHDSEPASNVRASDSTAKPTSRIAGAPNRPSLEHWIIRLAERRMQLERAPHALKELSKRGF
jgi:hypothetical protein